MKLLRYGEKGSEKPGLLDDDGVIRDLSQHVDDISGDMLGDASLDTLRRLDPASLPRVPQDVRIGSCLAYTRNFIGLGLNYADHAAESGAQPPKEPLIFNKAPNSLAGPNDDLILPAGSTKVDYEVELAFVIGKHAWQVSTEQASEHIAGYCICNDVSERAWQMERSGQWVKGKSAPGFGPLGPWLVTRDEVPDPLALSLTLDVNGQRRQDSNTRQLIFGPEVLVSHLSHFMALEPGDVITTGTPAGVGLATGIYLKPGDHLKLEISGLGTQSITVRQGLV